MTLQFKVTISNRSNRQNSDRYKTITYECTDEYELVQSIKIKVYAQYLDLVTTPKSNESLDHLHHLGLFFTNKNDQSTIELDDFEKIGNYFTKNNSNVVTDTNTDTSTSTNTTTDTNTTNTENKKNRKKQSKLPPPPTVLYELVLNDSLLKALRFTTLTGKVLYTKVKPDTLCKDFKIEMIKQNDLDTDVNLLFSGKEIEDETNITQLCQSWCYEGNPFRVIYSLRKNKQ